MENFKIKYKKLLSLIVATSFSLMPLDSVNAANRNVSSWGKKYIFDPEEASWKEKVLIKVKDGQRN